MNEQDQLAVERQELQQHHAELAQQARLLDVFRNARHNGEILKDSWRSTACCPGESSSRVLEKAEHRRCRNTRHEVWRQFFGGGRNARRSVSCALDALPHAIKRSAFLSQRILWHHCDSEDRENGCDRNS